MLPVAIALIGTRPRLQTTAYVGWFGPRGLASIVFIVITLEGTTLIHSGVIVSAVVATITLSVYAHGLTARPLTDRYARWYQSHPRDELPRMESVPVSHQRWRRPVSAAAVPAHRTE
jgi:NhaP-type Na+/H+ or K+/H+ antiporter